MPSKFRFSLDGVDATARQFAEVRHRLSELASTVGSTARRIMARVSAVEATLGSLSDSEVPTGVVDGDVVVSPAHGGTACRNVYRNLLSLTPRRFVSVLEDGTFGVVRSTRDSMTDVVDADSFIPVDALRRVKWLVYRLKDDVNLKGDDAIPIVGVSAEDLDDAGLGFFVQYDDEGNPVGVDYPMFGVAALRLAQEAMGEVDELKALVGELASRIDRMDRSCTGLSDR